MKKLAFLLFVGALFLGSSAVAQTVKSKVAGDVLFVPAGTPHTATNVGTDNGAEPATYVVEKGKPLVTLVK